MPASCSMAGRDTPREWCCLVLLADELTAKLTLAARLLMDDYAFYACSAVGRHAWTLCANRAILAVGLAGMLWLNEDFGAIVSDFR